MRSYTLFGSMYGTSCLEITTTNMSVPSLKWILSEMVVESVMRDERLSSINPYFLERKRRMCLSVFLRYDGRWETYSLTLDAMYRSQNIEDFMRKQLRLLSRHEAVIREHILKSEG